MDRTLDASILEGNRLALARLLTAVENDTPDGRLALADLFRHTGRAHLIGVTGAPGTGKSSLVNQLVLHYRKTQNRRVAVIAVDPSSPFTGGAVLGDRVRMRDLSGDPGVFIRYNGIARFRGWNCTNARRVHTSLRRRRLRDHHHRNRRRGQSEVDIARLAHTIIVVEAPGFGDEIQALKAGILEIADVLVINKADRPGVENIERALRSTLEVETNAQYGQRLGNAMSSIWDQISGDIVTRLTTALRPRAPMGLIVLDFKAICPTQYRTVTGTADDVPGGRSAWADRNGITMIEVDINMNQDTLMAHEIGHNFYLSHWEVPAGDGYRRPIDHDQNDHNCMMSYAWNLTGRADGVNANGLLFDGRFCGKCNLKLRGWTLSGAGLPASS